MLQSVIGKLYFIEEYTLNTLGLSNGPTSRLMPQCMLQLNVPIYIEQIKNGPSYPFLLYAIKI